MYLMYIDESGDIGQTKSPTNYFILSALIVHESKWFTILHDLNNFRTSLKNNYGLLKKEEIHASVFATGNLTTKNSISHPDRIKILLECLDWLATRSDISLITVSNNKRRPSADIFMFTWNVLIQRFENTLRHANFPIPLPLQSKSEFSRDQRGLIMSDNTDGGKLKSLLRKLRHINYIPNMQNVGNRNIPLESIIEDPIMRDSRFSYLHQMADVVAYFARQIYEPNNYFKRNNLSREYGKLQSIVNPNATKMNTNFGIVEI